MRLSLWAARMEPIAAHFFESLTRYEREAQRVDVDDGDGTVTLSVHHAGNARATPVVVPAWLWRAYAQRRQRG